MASVYYLSKEVPEFIRKNYEKDVEILNNLYGGESDSFSYQKELESLNKLYMRALIRLSPDSIHRERSFLKVYSAEHLAYTIFNNIISGFVDLGTYRGLKLEPLSKDLNIDKLDLSFNRGLVTCHGRKHSPPFLPPFISSEVEWTLVDINKETWPDIVLDITKIESLSQLGYFDYSINHYCPFNYLNIIFAYIYTLRRIQTPGGLIILNAPFGIDTLDKLGLGLTLHQLEYIYIEYMNLVLNYCGCSDLKFYNPDFTISSSLNLTYNKWGYINSNIIVILTI